MSEQPISITQDDLKHAQELRNNGQLSEMYDYLASKGDRYAVLAKGVVEGNTVLGAAALEFIEHTAKNQGKTWTEANAQDIAGQMATGYLQTLTTIAGDSGVVNRQIMFEEAQFFHDDVFQKSDLGKEAWTLHTPAKLLGQDGTQEYWEEVLYSAGDSNKEFDLAVKTATHMAGMHQSLELMGSIATNEQVVEAATEDIESWFANYANYDAVADIWEVSSDDATKYLEYKLQSIYEQYTDGFVDSINLLFGENSLESKSIGFSNTNTVDSTPTWVDQTLNDHELEEPVDLHYFDTTTNALSPWKNSNIFSTSSTGSIYVNKPDIQFSSVGSLYNAEASIHQDYQYGSISHSQYSAFTDFVSKYSLQGLIDNFESYSGSKPATKRAFYTVVTEADNTPSVADKTRLLVNNSNQVATVAQLQALDSDGDEVLSSDELNNLNFWQDLNEDGYIDSGELVNLSSETLIKQSDYAFYTHGNTDSNSLIHATPVPAIEHAQPIYYAEPNIPNSGVADGAGGYYDYRYLRDNDNLFAYYNEQGQPNGFTWRADQIKVNLHNQDHLIGTDGDDIIDMYDFKLFPISQYSLYGEHLIYILAGDGDDAVAGSDSAATNNKGEAQYYTVNYHIWGGIGEDELIGFLGDDHIYGEQDHDVIFGHVGDDILHGGAGNDKLVGFTASNDTKQSLSVGETDNDRLYGGEGNDELQGGLGDDYLDGGMGNDFLHGQEGEDELWGGDGDDELQGGDGDDQLMGGDGADTIAGQVGNDTIWGGEGNDEIKGFTATNETKQSLDEGEMDNDTIYGGAGNDIVDGGFGDDYLDGGVGDDILNGGQGNDELWGGLGDDGLLGNEGNDQLVGGSGNDALVGGVGNDKILGGDGNDWIYGLKIDHKTILDSNETDKDILYGGAGNDFIEGGYGNDYLYGDDGNDKLYGQVGDDIIYGGAGNDIVVGGFAGFVGKHTDDGKVVFQVYETGSSYAIVVDPSDNDDNRLYGGAGQDTLIGGKGNDYLDGGTDSDVMLGNFGDDTYVVNSAHDQIYESGSEDIDGYDTVISSVNYRLNMNVEALHLLEGFDIHGTGNDLDNKIIGNSSDNILDGVSGADEMIGGRGNDTYYVDNINDTVTEDAEEGDDTVNSSISYELGSNVENLTLLDFSKPEKGIIDGQDVLVYGFSNRFQLDYFQGDGIEGYLGTCALTSIANLLVQSGMDITEREVVYQAISNDWAVTDPEASAYEKGGSNHIQQQAILDSYGIESEAVLGYQETAIANLVRSGRGIMLAVDAGVLWGQEEYGLVNHVITLTGVAYGSNNELKGFYIADSGRREVSDMARFVDVELLREAANTKNAYFIYTREAIKLWNEDIDGTGNKLDNNIIGTRGDNVLQGLEGNDTIRAGAGNDILLGGSGSDTLIGGAGVDTFDAGEGDDTLVTDNNDILTSAYINGGEGYDTLVIKGDSEVSVNLEELNIESLILGDGVSTVTTNDNDIGYLIYAGTNTANITTAGGKDIIYGGESIDTINSGAGDDYIVAGEGDDVINAGDGDDLINAGIGNDTINAGSGADTIHMQGDLDIIYGGSGADVFKLSDQDQQANNGLTNLIKDFELGVDILDLSNVKTIRSIDDISISNVSQNGKTYAKVDVGNNKNAIYLEGITANSLTQDNFEFNNHRAINLAEVELSTNEDQGLTITSEQLLVYAIDVDSDDLSVVNLSIAANNATLTDNNNGTWTLTPKANFSGELELSYQINDGYELTDAKANIKVEAVADEVIISKTNQVNQTRQYGLNSENDDWDNVGYHKLVNSYENYQAQEGSSAVLLQTTGKSGVSGTKTNSSSIDNFLSLGDNSVKDVSSQATNGSALKSNFVVNKGDSISFRYLFDTDEYQPYVDFATYSIGDEVYKLSSVADVGNFGNSGWKTVSFVADTTGNLGFAVLNLKDSAVNSSLLIDNVVINGGGNGIQVGEAYTLPLDIALSDTDGSESLTIIIKGLPDTATLSHGTLLTNGHWQLTQAQYETLEITFSEQNKTYDLVVDIISTESINGDTTLVSENIQVKVTNSSELTDLSFSVAEDNLLVVDKSVIANNIGVNNITITHIESENSITSVDESGNIRIIPNDNFSGLEALSYTVVGDNGNEYHGNINVDIVARADSPLLLIETNDYVFDFSSGNLGNWQTVGDVDVVSSYDGFNSADNDGYMARLTTGYGSVDQNILESFMGMGNGKLDSFNGNATNGSAMQTVIDVKTGDVVSFEYIFSTNDYAPYNDFALVNIGSDSFKLSDVSTVGDFGASDGWQKFQYVATSDGKLNLAVANLLDTEVSSSLMVDNVVISSNSTLEVESNSTLALPITAVLNDTDGSETLTIGVKNLPNEITLNNGVKQSDGTYLLTQDDLSNLQLITGDFSGHIEIEIEAKSVEASNGDTALSSKTLSIDVIMQGDANDNQLIGDAGDNIIKALAGDDTLVGNAGDDTLSGGLGADIFDYNSNNDGHDIITDFNLSEGDKLDISDFVDYQANNNLADFVAVENTDDDSVINIDSDGAGIGDSYVSITLLNTTLSFEDLSDANAFVVL